MKRARFSLAILLLVFLAHPALAQAPQLTLAVDLLDDGNSIRFTMSPSSSAAGCELHLFAASSEAALSQAVADDDSITERDGEAGDTQITIEALGHIRKQRRRPTADVYFTAKVNCGDSSTVSPTALIVLTRRTRRELRNHRQFRTVDEWIRDLDGKLGPNTKYDLWQQDSFFRGANMVAWGDADSEGDYNLMTQEDFHDLKATGANFVQLSLLGTHDHRPGFRRRRNQESWMSQMVDMAKEAGLYYVIAVRSGPGRLPVDINGRSRVWNSKRLQARYGRMLRGIVENYCQDDSCVGLALTVEPDPYHWRAESPEELQQLLNRRRIDLARIQDRWVDWVRKADPLLPVIAQAGGWSGLAYFRVMTALKDPYVVYDCHNYEPWEFSNENESEYPGTYYDLDSNGDLLWNKARLEHYFGYVRTFQTSNGNPPVILGEFGANCLCDAALTYLRDQVDIALAYGWHLAIWGYHNDPYMALDKMPAATRAFMESVFDKTYRP